MTVTGGSSPVGPSQSAPAQEPIPQPSQRAPVAPSQEPSEETAAEAMAPAPLAHDAGRPGARPQLFAELAACEPDEPERGRIRDELVEMHLPLVEYLARRFRNRGEPLDDLVQVATIGLIKSVDRFDLERGVEFSTYATPDHRRRDQAPLPRQGLGDPRAAPAAGAQALADQGDERAVAAARALPDGRRTRRPSRDERGRGPGGPRVGQRLLRRFARRAGRRRRGLPRRRRHAGRRGRVARGRRVPRVAQAAARPAARRGRSASCCCASSAT